jgi:hypothetical protein
LAVETLRLQRGLGELLRGLQATHAGTIGFEGFLELLEDVTLGHKESNGGRHLRR